MKKVRLELDALAVESFAVVGGTIRRGTVLGLEYTEDAVCNSELNTYYESCLDAQCPDSLMVACGGGGPTRPPYKPLTGN